MTIGGGGVRRSEGSSSADMFRYTSKYACCDFRCTGTGLAERLGVGWGAFWEVGWVGGCEDGCLWTPLVTAAACAQPLSACRWMVGVQRIWNFRSRSAGRGLRRPCTSSWCCTRAPRAHVHLGWGGKHQFALRSPNLVARRHGGKASTLLATALKGHNIVASMWRTGTAHTEVETARRYGGTDRTAAGPYSILTTDTEKRSPGPLLSSPSSDSPERRQVLDNGNGGFQSTRLPLRRRTPSNTDAERLPRSLDSLLGSLASGINNDGHISSYESSKDNPQVWFVHLRSISNLVVRKLKPVFSLCQLLDSAVPKTSRRNTQYLPDTWRTPFGSRNPSGACLLWFSSVSRTVKPCQEDLA